MNQVFFLSIFLQILSFFPLCSQNTIGLLSFDEEKQFGGYNLFYPENQPHVFLINHCGELINIWEDDLDFIPGKTAYFMNDGNLLRGKTPEGIIGGAPSAGGAGGIIEILNWDNVVLWADTILTTEIRQHHDIHPMENGNILVIIWEKKYLEEIIENGFDTLNNIQTELWPDFIQEINPATDEVVWEWHTWDHLIQDFDSSKLNFGNVGEHPELIDINYQNYSANKFDWMHSNALDYDPVKDQVLFCVRNFNEIWVIDHSTTTEEAAGHTGGNSGKGGDLLFRWGNPEAYQQGTVEDRKMFLQHDAQWIDDFVNPDYEYFGDIIFFNNRIGGDFSLGEIISPEWDEMTQTYLIENSTFLPNEVAMSFSHPDPQKNYSSVASSIQVLGNGHILMCAAREGYSFELNPEGELVWEYETPLSNGAYIPQGFEVTGTANFTFQMERYPEDFVGFEGKDLSPKGWIELEPNEEFCMTTNIYDENLVADFKIFPNPTSNFLNIQTQNSSQSHWQIWNQFGQLLFDEKFQTAVIQIDISSISDGVYFAKELHSGFAKKIVVEK